MSFLLSVTYAAILGILSHYVGESLPRSWFYPERFPYKPFFWEQKGKIYEKIGIRKWKTKMPDMSRIMKDMLPKRVTAGVSSQNIQSLIKETCVAEFVHQFLCLLSVGIYFIMKNGVGILLVVICIVGNLPFIMIQRYNRPHLIVLRDHLMIREEKHKRAAADFVM